MIALIAACTTPLKPAEPAVHEGEAPGWLHVSLGEQDGCGVQFDGTIRCWGGGPLTTGVPEGPYLRVSVGTSTACAVTAGGEVATWGEPVALPGAPPYRDVGCAQAAGCVVTAERTVSCWGPARFLAGAPTDGGYTRVLVRPAADGGVGACAWGPAVGAACWADLGGAALSWEEHRYVLDASFGWDGPCFLYADGTSTCHATVPVALRPPGPARLLAQSWRAACVVLGDGSIACADRGAAPSTTLSPGELRARDLYAGPTSFCAVQPRGTLACWGEGPVHPP